MWQKPPLGVQLNVERGLVGYWLMNEGAGSIVNDLSGNSNPATSLTPIWSAGKFGVAPAFGAINNRYLFSTVLSFASGQPFSIASWWKTTDNSATAMWVSRGSGSGTYEKVGSYQGELYIRAVINGTTEKFGTMPTQGEWHHLVITRNSANIVYTYLNGGGPSLRFGGAAQASISNWRAIGEGYANAQYWPGSIENISFYNRALSSSEAAQLYQNPYARLEREPIELWAAATSVGIPPAGDPGIMTLNTGYWGPTFNG